MTAKPSSVLKPLVCLASSTNWVSIRAVSLKHMECDLELPVFPSVGRVEFKHRHPGCSNFVVASVFRDAREFPDLICCTHLLDRIELIRI